MELSTNKKAIQKVMEAEAFNETALDIVAVKSAPWLKGVTKFGYVRSGEYRAGAFSVHLRDGGTCRYATLDAMLDEWIGD